MERILSKLENDTLTSKEIIYGMEICSEIVVKNDFRFAYDYFLNILIEVAPRLTKEKYLDISKKISIMTSYMHRFEIPNSKLPSLSDVAKQYLEKCL